MNESLIKRCENFIRFRELAKRVFRLDSSYMYPITGILLSGMVPELSDAEALERLKNCRELLRSEMGFFSYFRGLGEQAIVAMLAVSDDPADKLNRAADAYTRLKQDFFRSSYLPLGAMFLSDEPDIESSANKAKRLYRGMQEAHPLLTSQEDSVYSVVLAQTDRPEEQLLTDMETCYRLLKPDFWSGDNVQSLAEVLAIGDQPAEEKCQRVIAVYDSLKLSGRKLRIGYELPILGILAMLPVELSLLTDMVMEADSRLSEEKGYGILGLGKNQRLLHAGILVAAETGASKQAVLTASMTAAVSLQIAQQIAISAAVAASTAASNASHN